MHFFPANRSKSEEKLQKQFPDLPVPYIFGTKLPVTNIIYQVTGPLVPNIWGTGRSGISFSTAPRHRSIEGHGMEGSWHVMTDPPGDSLRVQENVFEVKSLKSLKSLRG